MHTLNVLLVCTERKCHEKYKTTNDRPKKAANAKMDANIIHS